MVNSIMRNLLSNAVKFTYPKGNIKVMAQVVENNMISIQVSDNGIGIPEGLKESYSGWIKKFQDPEHRVRKALDWVCCCVAILY